MQNTLGAELLRVHVSYGPLIQALLRKFNGAARAAGACPIRAFAHITGGGFVDNLPRILPRYCDAVIRQGSWELLPIFQLLAAKGGVPPDELYQVFNMGIGMVAVVAADRAAAVLKFIRARRHKAWCIGEVVKGRARTRIQ